MDDKLKKLYELYTSSGLIKTTDFNTFSSADETQRKKLYDLGKNSGLFKTTDYQTFSTAFSPIKKKVSTESPSQQKKQTGTSATVKTTTQKPSVSSAKGKPEGLYSMPGNELAVYKKSADGWYVDNNRSGNFIKLQKGDVKKRIQNLESNSKKMYDPSYENNITWQSVQKEPKEKEQPSVEKQLAQEAFKEDFFITPKENMPSMDQVDFVAKEKAKRELGENANENDILAASEKYKKEGTLKLLKREGYDVDVNADFNDPKVRKALAEYNANQDLKQKSQVKQNKLFDLTDKIITSQKMGYTEEALVPLLSKNFGSYGFQFEESGLGDAMTVRYSADGITFTDDLQIDLQSSDPDAEMNKLKVFINNKYLKDSEKAALNNERLKTKDLIEITAKNPYKYGEYMLSEGEFDNYITSEYRSANDLKKQIDGNIGKFQQLSQEYSRTNDQNIFNQIKELETSISKDQRNLAYKLADIEQTENKYKESVGSYVLQREKQGNFVGGLFASASKGITAVPRLMFNVGADILPELLPNKGLNPLEYQKMIDEGMSDSDIGNVVSSKIKREVGKDLKQGITSIGSLGTVNEEYFSSVDRNILEQAVFGLTESVGASLSGGGNAVAQGLAFFGMSYNSMADELSSKEFDNLNKWEKSAISGVYGLMIGQLEKIGFNMASGQMASPLMKKFSATVVKNALREMPKNATIETVDQLIGTSLKNTMRATGIKVVNGALSEGTTEGVQSLAEISMKNLVNEIHDKKVFEYVPDLTTKKGVVEALESSLYEAAAGAIGGAIMGSFDTYRQSRANEASDEKFQNMYQALTDNNTLRAVKMNEITRYKNGEISREQARSNINEINKTVGTLNKIPSGLGTRGTRVAFELLTEKEGLQNKIEGKDKNLVSVEINRIAEIDNQLKTISEDATKESNIQQQEGTAEGSVVQREGTYEGQQEVGQGKRPDGETTQQGTDLGNRPIEGGSIQEEITQAPKVQVAVAPFFDTKIKTVEEANNLRQNENYVAYKQSLQDLGNSLGVSNTVIDEMIGGYENESGDRIMEISNKVTLEGATIEQAEEFASIAASIAPEVQEASIAVKYVQEGDDTHNANEYQLKVSDVNEAMNALQDAGIYNFSIDENNGIVSFIDVFDFKDEQLNDKIGRFIDILDKKGVNYEQSDYQPIESRYVDKGKRKEVLRRIKSKRTEAGQRGESVRNAIEKAIKRDSEFQGTTYAEYTGEPTAGNRLFNEPLQEVRQIADRYYERVFRSKRPVFEGTTELNVERAKKIASAFEQMKHDPNNKTVKKAYQALVNETIAQYADFENAGYVIEINNDEPYANSKEMIDDLRNNKRIKIFSTESGFGGMPITDKQRKENPLLADSGLKDVNGNTLLVNDIFRAIHDFYGHAELGNSFGPKGEENAWNVHARMFSPLARRAMTTETRGQNSWVNFSGINDEVQKLRDKAASLRDQGNIEESQKVVNEIYDKFRFADQKIGLLPKEFSEYEVAEEEQFIASEMIKERTNLQRVYDYLDKLDKSLDETLGPDKLNDITRVLPAAVMKVVIKALKVSVQTGMTLEQAIKDYAKRNNIDEKKITDSLYSMTDYQNRKTRERITGEKQPVVKISKEAKEAKEITKLKTKKVIVNEYAALKSQLRLEAKAARESQADLKGKQRMIIAAVNQMKRQGKISANQASLLAKKVVYLNVYNPVMVDRYLTYAERLFKNADYQNSLSKAFKVKSSIKKFMKNNQASVVGMAKDFLRVNPSMVEDIDQYLQIAETVMNAVKRSKTESGLALKIAADLEAVSTYTDTELAIQEEILKKERLKEYQYLVDEEILSDKMTLSEINEVIKLISEGETVDNRAEKEKQVRNLLDQRFNNFKIALSTLMKEGVGPTMEEDIKLSERSKDVISRVLKMDLNDLPVVKAYEIVEALDNFLMNNIIDGLEAKVEAYEGAIAAKKMEQKGITSRPIDLTMLPKPLRLGKKIVSKIRNTAYEDTKDTVAKKLARAEVFNLATLPVLTDFMFKGVRGALDFTKSLGLNAYSNGVAKTTKVVDNLLNEYGDKFSKTKPNGEDFNSIFNIYERGVLAYMRRTIDGSEQKQNAEFNRRLSILRESIDVMRESGDSNLIEKADVYEKVFEKLGINNNGVILSDIESNADKVNKSAVDWWTGEWSKIYSELYDISLSVYNTKLGRDLNYIPDRYARVDSKRGVLDETGDKYGAFAIDLGLVTDKTKAGVLMEARRDFKSLKRENISDSRYVNLDFDISNASSYKSAMLDINTAAAINRIDAFLKSPSLNKIIKDKNDRDLLVTRVNNYIRRTKAKTFADDYSLAELDNIMNSIASFGTSMALAGLDQPILQSVPLLVSSMFTAGANNIDFAGLISDRAFHSWIDRSGMAIANRGIESTSAIETANKNLEKLEESKIKNIISYLPKLNMAYLRAFMANPDKWIARNAWKAFYIQDLKRQGIYTKGIDWNTHEINKDAADYAQHMVDRQQNVSDTALSGEFMASQDPFKKMMKKVLLPMANFILNQKNRMYSDIATVVGDGTSKEDRLNAIKSLAGLSTEIVMYNALAFSLKELIYIGVNALYGYEEPEEEKEKRKKNAKKFALTNIVKDILSPVPATDALTLKAADMIGSLIQEYNIDDEEINVAVAERNLYLTSRNKDKMTSKEEKDFREKYIKDNKINLSNQYKKGTFIDLGTASILFDNLTDLYKKQKMLRTGKYEVEYNGKVTEKNFMPEDMDEVKQAVFISFLYNAGLLTRDFNRASNYIIKNAKNKGLNDAQLERYNEVKKEVKTVEPYMMYLIKKKDKINNILSEINFVKSEGGLTREQSFVYNKVYEVKGDVKYDDLMKIKSGMSAGQILK